MQQDHPIPNQGNSWRRIVMNEWFSLCIWLYYMLLKPVVFLGIIVAIIYAVYIYVICQNFCFLPLICRFCPGERAFANIPPINTIAQQTAHVANALTNTDVTSVRRLVAIQTILAEIDSRVELIDIDETVKEQLKRELEYLDKQIENGIDELIQMHATIGSALDNIKIHTEHTLKDLMRVMNGEKSRFGSERIGEPQTETERMDTLRDDYVSSLFTEVDQVVSNIKAAKMTLEQIRKKLKTIQSLYAKGKDTAERKIDDLKYGNIWRRIFGGDSLNIERQQRAINTLEEFINFNKLFLHSIGNVIVMIEEYKTKITQLTKTKIPSNAQNFKFQIFLEQIQEAVKQLSKSKEEFDEKIKRSKQQERIEL